MPDAPVRHRPRPLRRGPLRGVDDPPRGSPHAMQPAHPATPRSPAPPRRSPSATSRSPPTPTARSTPTPSPAPTCSSSPTRPTPSGRRRSAAARPASSPPRSTRSTHFVARGGGLIVLGETEQDKYGNNLNELLARFGIQIENATVQDYEHHHHARPPGSSPPSTTARAAAPAGADPLAGVEAACFYRAGTLDAANGARALARTHADRLAPQRPARRRRPRTARAASSSPPTPTSSATTASPSSTTSTLWLNLVYWAAQPAFAADGAAARLAGHRRPRLAPAQGRRRGAPPHARRPTARSTPPSHDPATPAQPRRRDRRRRRRRSSPASRTSTTTSTRSPPTSLAWADAGFAKPAFDRSIEAFRPERERRDGIEHLVVFPMYKQNASRDTCFEALVVRVPWPDWIAELERTATTTPSSSRSPSSTTPPATTPSAPSSSPRPSPPPSGPPSTTSARSSATARPSASAASAAPPPRSSASTCRPTPPACSPRPSSRASAYMLWDLVHDRTHMRGDLPFDPFMIRQRSPYWMYSLEELRCDLTAFGEAVKLEREGFAFARHVQYAILFDRLFRFPVTGSRVRNYDGLGGQLLFAFLHREGYLHWTDNRLTIEWGRIAEGVGAPARARPGPLPLRHRPLEARPVDRRPRPRRRLRAAGRDARSGRRTAATCPRSRSPSSSSTSSATTSSRSASSTPSSSRSSSRRSRARPGPRPRPPRRGL